MSTDLREAFDQASGKKTPWNPSKTATARVTTSGGALPAPTTCPHCQAKVDIVNNEAIYGRPYGEWPWAYSCTGCRAYVGMHPYTAIPLGTLATPEIREARKRAKSAFNPIWQNGRMKRGAAYAWLAEQLGIPKNECHIGWSGIEQCERIVAICTMHLKARSA